MQLSILEKMVLAGAIGTWIFVTGSFVDCCYSLSKFYAYNDKPELKRVYRKRTDNDLIILGTGMLAASLFEAANAKSHQT